MTTFNAIVREHNTSLRVTIPKDFVIAHKIKKGSNVTLEIKDVQNIRNKIIIVPK